jgi:hypothetical protein
VELGILVFGVITVGVLLWANDCNIKANQDVMRCLAHILTSVSKKEITQEECSKYLLELENVSLYSHWFRLFTLRNPTQLYTPGLARFF